MTFYADEYEYKNSDQNVWLHFQYSASNQILERKDLYSHDHYNTGVV